MRILLAALNARYVHTNLAIRCLREVLAEQGQAHWEIVLKEFSINDHLEHIAGEIYEAKPDVIGFSCYIWNISQTLSLLRRLRPVLPRTYFILGGPEVSFEPEELLVQHPFLDAVIIGEGETSFPAVIKAWDRGEFPWDIPGLAWRFQKPLEHKDMRAMIPSSYEGKYQDTGAKLIFTNQGCTSFSDLNCLPNPYEPEEDLRGRLAYVETSRGCPFNCQFCISSTFQGIRFLEPENFRLILCKLFAYGARTIKFVDRTFNARKNHAFQILDVFREEAEKTQKEAEQDIGDTPRAHCEMAGELLDEDWLEYLKNYPQGMIQLEIGVQSTHQPTLEAVKRPQSFAKWQDKVRFLQQECRIPVHLDLIAGLPLEGWGEFRRSFNDVFAVRPDNLQLGFLKVLKGSGIWEHCRDYDLVYSPDPPYTILKTKELSHDELLALARIEEILEKYYNSGRFQYSLETILACSWQSPFDFFHSLAEYWHGQGWFKREWNPKSLFLNLWEFLQSRAENAFLELWREALRFDYYLLEKPGSVPEYLAHYSDPGSAEIEKKEREKKKEEIRNDPCWQEIILEAKNMDRRQWARATAVEFFAAEFGGGLAENSSGAWYLFYYGRTIEKFRYTL